jgi:hypothetical protein
LLRIDTALNISVVIFVLIVCIILGFVTEQIEGGKVAGTSLMSETDIVTFHIMLTVHHSITL